MRASLPKCILWTMCQLKGVGEETSRDAAHVYARTYIHTAHMLLTTPTPCYRLQCTTQHMNQHIVHTTRSTTHSHNRTTYTTTSPWQRNRNLHGNTTSHPHTELNPPSSYHHDNYVTVATHPFIATSLWRPHTYIQVYSHAHSTCCIPLS